MKKFIEYRPGCFSGYDNKEYEIKSLDEIFKLKWVANFKDNDFHCFAKSDDKLMALYNFNSDSGKCKQWWVIGFLIGFSEKEYEEFGLKNYTELIERN